MDVFPIFSCRIITHENTRFVVVINDKLKSYGKLGLFPLSESDVIDFSSDKEQLDVSKFIPNGDLQVVSFAVHGKHLGVDHDTSGGHSPVELSKIDILESGKGR